MKGPALQTKILPGESFMHNAIIWTKTAKSMHGVNGKVVLFDEMGKKVYPWDPPQVTYGEFDNVVCVDLERSKVKVMQ